MDGGIVMLLRLVQLLNTPLGIVVTKGGIVILVKLEQLWKHEPSILVIEECNETLARLLHL